MRSRDRAVCLALLALLVRLICGLHSYSGQGKAPRFGDYEAQRHWMEITLGTPPRYWYVNTTDNDLDYWGLDYPPLSAYQSWLFGKAVEEVEPEAVALHTSRGYETPRSKTLMRWTAVFADITCYFPAVWAAAHTFGGQHKKFLVSVLMLLNPAQVLIDHGHFQYNSISLGLAAGAAAAICKGHHVLGSILYCFSLNHKQMSLYYAPAFFSYLLASSLRRPTAAGKLGSVAKLGITVILSIAILWLPYLGSVDGALSVVHRVFPTKRGLFEDYVANFWCVSSLVIKWKRIVPPLLMLRLCTLTTLAAFGPSMVLQFRDLRRQRLLISMALAALSFYQFSFQVHEKSILLPLLPLSMTPEHLVPSVWTTVVAVFSMGPLLIKDGLVLAAMATVTIYLSVFHALATSKQGATVLSSSKSRWTIATSALGMALIGVSSKLIAAPQKRPFLWDALAMAWSYIHFAGVFIYLYMYKRS